ncbi:hypothetical protein BDF14DRAFT_711574 [Spinellus fusiger]|nr:hypothetical protein BDF14DRAFT_711574 [Spinellus fusiger]
MAPRTTLPDTLQRKRPVLCTLTEVQRHSSSLYSICVVIIVLLEFLYVNVGGRVFKVSWDLFRKEGINFFTGPLMDNIFSPHYKPGVTVMSPVYIERDPDLFADIISHLRGYTIQIKDEVHRRNLLKDAQYYVFRQLADKLITADTALDGFSDQNRADVLLLLTDVRIPNVQLPRAKEWVHGQWSECQLQYKKNTTVYALLVQLSGFFVQVHYNGSFWVSMDLEKDSDQKLMKIAQAVKAAQVDPQLHIDDTCALTIDDGSWSTLEGLLTCKGWETCLQCPHTSQHAHMSPMSHTPLSPQHPKDSEAAQENTRPPIVGHQHSPCKVLRLGVQRAMTGLYLVDQSLVMRGVRLEAISSRRQLNMKRPFLPKE